MIIILFIKNTKLFFKSFSTLFISFILLTLIYNGLLNLNNFPKQTKKTPFTSFIMMGLKEKVQGNDGVGGVSSNTVYGVFDLDDIYLTHLGNKYNDKVKILTKEKKLEHYSILADSNITYKDKINTNIKEINLRFKNINMFKFFYNKNVQTWMDGTCYAPIKLERGQTNYNFVDEIFCYNGKYIKFYLHISTIIHLTMMFLFSISAYKNSKKDTDYNFLFTAIFGMLLLLTFWETRSRYIVNYLLIIYLLSFDGLLFVYKKIKSKLK